MKFSSQVSRWSFPRKKKQALVGETGAPMQQFNEEGPGGVGGCHFLHVNRDENPWHWFCLVRFGITFISVAHTFCTPLWLVSAHVDSAYRKWDSQWDSGWGHVYLHPDRSCTVSVLGFDISLIESSNGWSFPWVWSIYLHLSSPIIYEQHFPIKIHKRLHIYDQKMTAKTSWNHITPYLMIMLSFLSHI